MTEFREATTELTRRIPLARVADQLDVPVSMLHKARLAPTAGSYRNGAYRRVAVPWREGVAQVARREAARLLELAEKLEREAKRERGA